MSETKAVVSESLTVKAPAFQTARFTIRGTAPLVMNRFSQKAQETIRAGQAAGSKKKKGLREAKDFDACYEGAKHVSSEGWLGFPASAIRCACVDACRLVGFPMTKAKLCLFTVADGFDAQDGTPLFRVNGEPEKCEHYVRNETGVVDMRARCMVREWTAHLRIRFDSDQFTLEDVTNLLARVGTQCGIGEGRPNSKKSTGMGWGTFEVVGQVEVIQ